MKIGDIVRIKHSKVIVLIRGYIQYDDRKWLSCVSLQRTADDHAGDHSDHLEDELEPLGVLSRNEIENLKSELELVEEIAIGIDSALSLAMTDKHYGGYDET